MKKVTYQGITLQSLKLFKKSVRKLRHKIFLVLEISPLVHDKLINEI